MLPRGHLYRTAIIVIAAFDEDFYRLAQILSELRVVGHGISLRNLH